MNAIKLNDCKHCMLLVHILPSMIFVLDSPYSNFIPYPDPWWDWQLELQYIAGAINSLRPMEV